MCRTNSCSSSSSFAWFVRGHQQEPHGTAASCPGGDPSGKAQPVERDLNNAQNETQRGDGDINEKRARHERMHAAFPRTVLTPVRVFYLEALAVRRHNEALTHMAIITTRHAKPFKRLAVAVDELCESGKHGRREVSDGDAVEPEPGPRAVAHNGIRECRAEDGNARAGKRGRSQKNAAPPRGLASAFYFHVSLPQ